MHRQAKPALEFDGGNDGGKEASGNSSSCPTFASATAFDNSAAAIADSAAIFADSAATFADSSAIFADSDAAVRATAANAGCGGGFLENSEHLGRQAHCSTHRTSKTRSCLLHSRSEYSTPHCLRTR